MRGLEEGAVRAGASGREQVGATAPAAYASATLAIEGMSCASCALRLEKGLKRVPGVAEATVNLASERAVVHYDPASTALDDLVAKVEAVGYRATPLLQPAPAVAGAEPDSE